MQKKDELRRFGDSLHVMRKNSRMTQMQLADALDVDYRSISRYETGEVEMGALLYDKMLGVLGQKTGDDFALGTLDIVRDLAVDLSLVVAGDHGRVRDFERAVYVHATAIIVFP